MRIGDVDKGGSGLVKFGDENKLVAWRDSVETDTILEVFNLDEPVSGRYLTLQTYVEAYMVMDEISVFT